MAETTAYDAMLAAAQSAYDASVGGINQQITAAPQLYQQYSNQAYVNSLLAERARQENMANMGYSGGGVGMSQTLQQRNSNALNTNLASIGTARQEYVNSLQSDLLTQKASYDQTIAGIEADRAEAKAAEMSRADQLYAAGIIGADQYEAMTGIKPVTRRSGSGGGGAYEDYKAAINMGMTPDEARAYSGYVPANYTGSISGSGGRTYYINGKQVDYKTWSTQYNPLYT